MGGGCGNRGKEDYGHYSGLVAGIVPLVEQDTIPDNLQVLKLKLKLDPVFDGHEPTAS